MRVLFIAAAFAALSGVAVAQTMQTAPSASSGASPQAAPAPDESGSNTSRRGGNRRGADYTRDEYIQRAVDRARRNAETRFDRMDTNHDGILTADERRAARAARRGGGSQ